MNRLNEILSNTEKNLNYAGWIPGISMASGSLRMIMGKVELLAGSLIGLADLAQFKLDSPGWTYAAHGIANICRGLLKPFLLIGNLAGFFTISRKGVSAIPPKKEPCTLPTLLLCKEMMLPRFKPAKKIYFEMFLP